MTNLWRPTTVTIVAAVGGILALGSPAVGGVRTESVCLDAIEATSVYSGNPGQTYCSEITMVVGEFSGDWRSLIRWDIGESIPSGATITSAEIRLEQGCLASTSAVSIAVDDVTQSWSECTTTWNSRPSTSSLGIIYLVPACSGPPVSITRVLGDDPALRAWVQGVVDGGSDDGLQLRASPLFTGDYLVFSSEDSTGKPQLCVEYELPVLDPDVGITSVTPDGSSYSAGDPISVTACFKNFGSGTAPTFKWGVALSRDAVYGGQTDYYFGGDQNAAGLAAGAVRCDASATLSVPSIPAGTYYVLARILPAIDGDGNPGNDWGVGGPIEIVEPEPDVAVTSVSVDPVSICPSTDTLGVTVCFQNIGDGDAGSFSWSVVLSEDNVLGGATDYYFGGNHPAGGLDAGQSRCDDAEVSIPAGLPAGHYYVLAAIDPPSGDTNAGNNWGAGDEIEVLGCDSPANLNGDCTLNLDDIDAFANCFIGGLACADLDGNGVLNFDDIDRFARAYLDGCP